MATSRKVSQFQCDDNPDSTGGTSLHSNHVNLRTGLIQVAPHKPTESFCGWLVGDRDLVGPFTDEGRSWANCSMLTGIVKKFNLLRKCGVRYMYTGNQINTHGGWWSNDLCLSRDALSNSSVVVDATVTAIIFALCFKVLSNVFVKSGG